MKIEEAKEILENEIANICDEELSEALEVVLNNSIPKKKIEDKLEQLNSEIPYCARQNGKTIKLGKIMALQELLEEDK